MPNDKKSPKRLWSVPIKGEIDVLCGVEVLGGIRRELHEGPHEVGEVLPGSSADQVAEIERNFQGGLEAVPIERQVILAEQFLAGDEILKE